jgi:glycosyltransferase involved in cell wall biosynthesis
MKIAFVTSHLTVYGGGGIFLRRYVNRLTEKGHELYVVAQQIDTNYYKFHDDVKLIEVGGYLPNHPFHWFNFMKIKNRYQKILENLDVSLYISQNFPSNYFCSQINLKDFQRHIYYCHEPFRYFHDRLFIKKAPFTYKIITWFLRRFFKKFDVIGAKQSDIILCNSRFTCSQVFNIYKKKGIVHYQGVEKLNNKPTNDKAEFDLREELHLDRNMPILFTLGLSHHMKGARELISIFSKVLKNNQSVKLLIAGKIHPYNKKILRKSIKDFNIPKENVIFYGFIKDDLLDDVYAQSTLTYYTPIDEAFGLIPLESMKNGTPVIAFEGGPSETIDDGVTGYVIKNKNLEKFAEKTVKLLQNPEILNKFSEQSKIHFRENFTLEKGVKKFIEILDIQ